MARFFLCFLVWLPVWAIGQSTTIIYTDVDELPYKKVVIKGGDTVTTYMDRAGQTIANLCTSGTAGIKKSLSDSIRRAVTDTWRRDSTQRERRMEYSFLVSSQGWSDARILSYDFGFHTHSELQAGLESVLDRFHPRSDADCLSHIQIKVVEYVDYPIRREYQPVHWHRR